MKLKKIMTWMILSSLLSTLSTTAFGYGSSKYKADVVKTVTICGEGHSRSNRTNCIKRLGTDSRPYIVDVAGGDIMYVKKLIISAEGVRNEATLEVMVNGDVKFSSLIPGRDPNYIVTIEENAQSIVFRSTNGVVKITSVKAVLVGIPSKGRYFRRGSRNFNNSVMRDMHGNRGHRPGPAFRGSVSNEAMVIAENALSIIGELRDFADHAEYGVYLLPIRKRAGNLLAVSRSRSAFSKVTLTALDALLFQIDAAYGYIDNAFERYACFELALELQTLGEQLADIRGISTENKYRYQSDDMPTAQDDYGYSNYQNREDVKVNMSINELKESYIKKEIVKVKQTPQQKIEESNDEITK